MDSAGSKERPAIFEAAATPSARVAQLQARLGKDVTVSKDIAPKMKSVYPGILNGFQFHNASMTKPSLNMADPAVQLLHHAVYFHD